MRRPNVTKSSSRAGRPAAVVLDASDLRECRITRGRNLASRAAASTRPGVGRGVLRPGSVRRPRGRRYRQRSRTSAQGDSSRVVMSEVTARRRDRGQPRAPVGQRDVIAQAGEIRELEAGRHREPTSQRAAGSPACQASAGTASTRPARAAYRTRACVSANCPDSAGETSSSSVSPLRQCHTCPSSTRCHALVMPAASRKRWW